MQDMDKRPVVKPNNEEQDDKFDINVGDVCTTLHAASKELLQKEVSAQNLHAACNAAQQIANLIRIGLEAKKLKNRLNSLK